MWGHTVQFWQSIADWLLLAAAILGALTVIGSFASSVISGQALKRLQTDADQRIALATARGEEARADAARANEHTARLENETEQARLETERLRQQMAWRRLSEDQIKKIASGLASLAIPLRMAAIANDPESMLFASDIRRALLVAGITTTLASKVIAGAVPVGIIIKGPKDDALRVGQAFVAAGLNVQIKEQAGDLKILVGSKPPPQ